MEQKRLRLSELVRQRNSNPAGLTCPECACRDLRPVSEIAVNGAARRTRICRHCGRTIQTTEIPL